MRTPLTTTLAVNEGERLVHVLQHIGICVAGMSVEETLWRKDGRMHEQKPDNLRVVRL